MSKKPKKKRKVKRTIRNTATLVHRIAISLHAEAEVLQEKTGFLLQALHELYGEKRP